MDLESEVMQRKRKGKSIFQISFELGISLEQVIKIIYGDSKISQTTRFKNYAPVRIKCLSCGKMFISHNKKTNRICNKYKREQEPGCFHQYIGY